VRVGIVLQVSDIHAVANPTTLAYGQPSDSNLQAVLRAGAATEAPDLVMATGDIADDADPASYARVANMLNSNGVPVRWVPGNHDDPARMDMVEPSWSTPIQLDNWLIVPLDTHWSGHVAGHVGSAELNRLRAMLSRASRQSVLLCLHHPPISDVCHHSDCQLTDNDKLLSIIDEHRNIRAVVSGHLHHPFDHHRRGVRYLGAPSTCVQAQHGLDPHLVLVDGHPAGRLITLNPDGTIITKLTSSRP
jgi:Icc protein